MGTMGPMGPMGLMGHENYLIWILTIKSLISNGNFWPQARNYNILFHKHSKTIQGVPKKTRISENVRHKHNTTFLKEP